MCFAANDAMPGEEVFAFQSEEAHYVAIRVGAGGEPSTCVTDWAVLRAVPGEEESLQVWRCCTCASGSCHHVKHLGGGATARLNAAAFERSIGRFLDLDSGLRRLTCKSRDAMPRPEDLRQWSRITEYMRTSPHLASASFRHLCRQAKV